MGRVFKAAPLSLGPVRKVTQAAWLSAPQSQRLFRDLDDGSGERREYYLRGGPPVAEGKVRKKVDKRA